MISFDRGGSNANLTPIYNSISILSSEIQDVYDSLSALPTDITSMMSLVASLTSNITELNDNTSQLADNFSNYLPIISSFNTSVLNNYELTSNAFNSSVLTDYAKTSDIPTNTGGGNGKYQYAFSELPSDANYANLYNITGNVESMTFYSSDSTKTGSSLLMTMAGGYFNSNSLESITSLYINNISEFYDNTGYIRSLQLFDCKSITGNSIDGVYLYLSKCSIRPDNTFSFSTISCNYVYLWSLNVSKCTTFALSRGSISSLTINEVRNDS
mgnify:CR=1 FL=1